MYRFPLKSQDTSKVVHNILKFDLDKVRGERQKWWEFLERGNKMVSENMSRVLEIKKVPHDYEENIISAEWSQRVTCNREQEVLGLI